MIDVLPASGADTVTWAFATGECGSEMWAGITPAQVAGNVQTWSDANKKYIISTGGAAGVFKCATDEGFKTFVDRYNSESLVGIDFDIEGGVEQADVDSLALRAKNAQALYPNLRISFTVACLGGNIPSAVLSTCGIMVMNSIKSVGLQGAYINLMAMDYGSNDAGNCVLNSDGKCDMGASAVQAAKNLHNFYNIPYSLIEITPMIGVNDAMDEVFSLSDATTVAAFAQQNGLGGVHFWSFDRDRDCVQAYPSSTCNSIGNAGLLGFTKLFAGRLVDHGSEL